MSKILENEFRKELYKNLTDAGYDKKEAQQIVGKKYYEALKEVTKDLVGNLMASIEVDNYEYDTTELLNNIGELAKLKEILA